MTNMIRDVIIALLIAAVLQIMSVENKRVQHCYTELNIGGYPVTFNRGDDIILFLTNCQDY